MQNRPKSAAPRRIGLLLILSLLPTSLSAADENAGVPSPRDFLGRDVGEDHHLFRYEETLSYFHALDRASDWLMMVKAGESSDGRPMEFAVISTPENLASWERYKEISRRLADSRGIDDAAALRLAEESKIIVHIDGGMHSDEAAAHQFPAAFAYDLLKRDRDPKNAEIFRDVILVLWPTLNPDGQTMVADWYLSHLGTEHETSPLPHLYQKYVGHDNNRDGFMLNMRESSVVIGAEQDYSPAIAYSQHQTSPVPVRMWVPPLADPVSANIHPLVRQWTSLIGMHIGAEFERLEKPGVAAGGYDALDNWYPGYLDYVQAFRHTIAFFTETALHQYATPYNYELDHYSGAAAANSKPLISYPSPWRGGWWRIGDAIDYMKISSGSVLETAAQYKTKLMYNRYIAARDAAHRYLEEGVHAYAIVPDRQWDVSSARTLVDKLIQNGVEVHEAASPVKLGSHRLAAGSWVILMDQPFSGLVQELFEAQVMPPLPVDENGALLKLPFDVTGWTLPMQMGVDVLSISSPVSKRDRRRLTLATRGADAHSGVAGSGNWHVLSARENAAYRSVNEALRRGATVSVSEDGQSFIVAGMTSSEIDSLARRDGVRARATSAPPINARALSSRRIGLYRPWKPSIDEGWTRWLLESYGFEIASIYNEEMKTGDLSSKYDAIIIPDISHEWLIDGIDTGDEEYEIKARGGAAIARLPAPYAGGIGHEGVQNLRAFVSSGGALIAFDSAADAAIDLLGLPVANIARGIGPDKFYCPGSLLEIDIVASGHPGAVGLPSSLAVMFESSPVFELKPGFEGAVLARYPEDESALKSGFLINDAFLRSKPAALDLKYGDGRVFLFGFRPQWRGQSHGSFKMVFNALYEIE